MSQAPNTSLATIQREYNSVPIPQRASDGYWNATAMCKATDKRWNDYWRNQGTQEFLAALSRSAGIPADQLVQVKADGPNSLRGTWVHRRVAIDLARWCSPPFAVLVNGWIEELLTTGRVELQPQQPRPWSLRISQPVADFRRELRIRHPGLWSVVTELSNDLLLLEDELAIHGLPLLVSDLPDGSAGQCWANYRRGKPWAMPVYRDCPLATPHADRMGDPVVVYPAVYSQDEFAEFNRWFQHSYVPDRLPEYLGRKYKRGCYPELVTASAADHASRRITGNHARLSMRAHAAIQACGRIRVSDYQRLLPQRQQELFDSN